MKYSLVLRADGKVFLGKHLDEDGEEVEDNTFENDKYVLTFKCK